MYVHKCPSIKGFLLENCLYIQPRGRFVATLINMPRFREIKVVEATVIGPLISFPFKHSVIILN